MPARIAVNHACPIRDVLDRMGDAWSVLVLYATRHLGMSAVGFGLLGTAAAVGGLLSTAMRSSAASRCAPRWWQQCRA